MPPIEIHSTVSRTPEAGDACMLHHAINNNLHWYCAVMDAHRLRYTQNGILWSLDCDPSPPYYSDIVTCSGGHSPDQLALIHARREERPGQRLSVADCYASLDPNTMALLGFSPLFDAQWFGGHIPANTPPETPLEFLRVESEGALAAWESRWQRWSPTHGVRVFPPVLLTNSGNHFWTLVRDGEPVGGAITHADEHTIGLSNVFIGTESASTAALRDAARWAARIGGGKAIVGYGESSELNDLAPLGVAALGTHRIWHTR